jgi:chromosome segregation ATPase
VLLINNYKIDKTIYQLINKTYDIIRQDRMKRESELKEENEELKKTKTSNKQEVQELKKTETSNRNCRKKWPYMNKKSKKSGSLAHLINHLEQRLTDKMETMNSLKRKNDVYQTLVQTKNNEINLLNQIHKKYREEESGVKAQARRISTTLSRTKAFD